MSTTANGVCIWHLSLLFLLYAYAGSRIPSLIQRLAVGMQWSSSDHSKFWCNDRIIIRNYRRARYSRQYERNTHWQPLEREVGLKRDFLDTSHLSPAFASSIFLLFQVVPCEEVAITGHVLMKCVGSLRAGHAIDTSFPPAMSPGPIIYRISLINS